jgi:hypothetical protein
LSAQRPLLAEAALALLLMLLLMQRQVRLAVERSTTARPPSKARGSRRPHPVRPGMGLTRFGISRDEIAFSVPDIPRAQN